MKRFLRDVIDERALELLFLQYIKKTLYFLKP
jgi:hypothetical protein